MPEWLMKYQYEKITDNSIVRFSSHFRGLTTIMWLPPQFLSLTPLPRKNWHSTSMCLDSFMNINGCFLLWRAKGETLMSAIDSQLPSSSGQDRPTDEVDRILSPGKLIILGLQHVLVMYAGAVAVPLMIGDRLGLSKEAIAMLISSDLFCCGIVTLLQCIGIGRFMGIRLPVIMSVTFAAVTPMIAIGMNPDIGLLGYSVPLSPRVLSPHY